MNDCAHLLQRLDDDGTLTCLVCDQPITDPRPITAIDGQLANIADDPFTDLLTGP